MGLAVHLLLLKHYLNTTLYDFQSSAVNF